MRICFLSIMALTAFATIFIAATAVPADAAQSADKAYYDEDKNRFVLEFSTGLNGLYANTIVDENSKMVHTTSNIEFSGQKTIALAVDEGVEITDGKYFITMVKGSDVINQTVEVQLGSSDDDDDGGSNVMLYVGGGAVALVAVGAVAFFFLRK